MQVEKPFNVLDTDPILFVENQASEWKHFPRFARVWTQIPADQSDR